jgi:hypothetical protein
LNALRRLGERPRCERHLDQDAWVSGHITLDELVARSQGSRGAETAAATDLGVLAVEAATAE